MNHNVTTGTSGVEQVNYVTFWRDPSTIVIQGSFFSIMQVTDDMTKAIKDSKGQYLFSEVGAGIKAIVLIGTAVQVFNFLEKNSSVFIENKIKELPDIYIGVTNYIKKAKYVGLFPLQDILVQTVNQASAFVPGNIVTDAGGVPLNLKGLYDITNSMSYKEQSTGQLLYVKISYFKEDKMEFVSKYRISLGDVLKYMQKNR
ncbi:MULTISPECIES: hypothetical protein [unclassified Shewanella]|uniref:hypothetical protein n=1 Tax=unclassified Shewanella TaxID=196818 RepID=UPI0021D9C9DE|nr:MULTISPECIES: hypothetical protein [unclassified Shewanella]MCU8036428.1 hypothetical protein [Shewanella sp. SM71]MCU8098375.1 hypothetical protein [Shewanella sp. SM102]